ncbi:unnamed protein product [Phaedon cochleariae]|uniref:Cilia- and flagella-associated protein 100-like n=1 Tax=Phaedon cochleariae TaxID=80249 RepID=A0A9P0DS39_PHACE|nr:unnamed protein product [Phaedon cochleariae]
MKSKMDGRSQLSQNKSQKSKLEMSWTDQKSASQESLPDQLGIVSQSITTDRDEVEVARLISRKNKTLLRKRIPKQSVVKPEPKSQQFYFTASPKVDQEADAKPLPYGYTKGLEEFAHKVLMKAWRDDVRVKELAVKCFEKPSYRNRNQLDLMKRLYVKDPPETKMKTILDVDPNYFTIVQGRPIPDKLSTQDYIRTLRESLRTKIINGYREDDIILLDENLVLEQHMIDLIQKNYQTYVNIFEEFLFKDHTTAMDLLRDAEKAADEAYDKWEALKKLSRKYAAARSSLYTSEGKWRNAKTYQKFLMQMSPLEWRERQGTFHRASAFMIDDDPNDPDDEENIFGKYRASLVEKGVSLQDILNVFRSECQIDTPPALYFEHPQQLIDAFRFMEMQNLNSLLHSEELAVPLNAIQRGMEVANMLFDNQISNLQGEVKDLEDGILWEERRADYLEHLAQRMLDKEFKELIMSDEALNLFCFVEDVYETRVGPNDANLNIIDMMRGIETKYHDELLNLDKVPRDQVALLSESSYEEQIRVMRLAEKASKQYAELERLNYRLMKAVGPPFEKPKGKVPKNRSRPIQPLPPALPPRRTLTVEEEEYLKHFTDFCEFTDDPTQYGIDTTVPPKAVDVRYDRRNKSTKASRYVSRVKGISNIEKMIMTNT